MPRIIRCRSGISSHFIRYKSKFNTLHRVAMDNTHHVFTGYRSRISTHCAAYRLTMSAHFIWNLRVMASTKGNNRGLRGIMWMRARKVTEPPGGLLTE